MFAAPPEGGSSRGDNPAGPVVLCWDIDGTLLTTNRAGMLAWEDALAELAGIRVSLRDFRSAGLTDIVIARRLVGDFAAAEANDPQFADRLLRRYEELLPSRLSRRQGRVMPGICELLDFLEERGDVLSILLTGNTIAGARAKLVHYELNGYFRGGSFADGAFLGGCPEDRSLADGRPGIARRALELLRDTQGPISPTQLFVIGDTPRDVACGEAIGARTVAVATGPYSTRELAECSPWWVLDRLPDPESFVARVTDAGG